MLKGKYKDHLTDVQNDTHIIGVLDLSDLGYKRGFNSRADEWMGSDFHLWFNVLVPAGLTGTLLHCAD